MSGACFLKLEVERHIVMIGEIAVATLYSDGPNRDGSGVSLLYTIAEECQ